MLTGKRYTMSKVGLFAKVGAILFFIWGILHIWVTYDGIENYLNGGSTAMFRSMAGGKNAPLDQIQFANNQPTTNLHTGLLLNFVINVGGFGVVGLFVAYKLWMEATWHAYLIGVFCIGIADLAFLFVMVYPGQVIALSFPVLLGPIIWFLAVLITPFGLSCKSEKAIKGKKHE